MTYKQKLNEKHEKKPYKSNIDQILTSQVLVPFHETRTLKVHFLTAKNRQHFILEKDIDSQIHLTILISTQILSG